MCRMRAAGVAGLVTVGLLAMSSGLFAAEQAHPLAGKTCSGKLTSRQAAWSGDATFQFEGGVRLDKAYMMDSKGSEMAAAKRQGEMEIKDQGATSVEMESPNGVIYDLSVDGAGTKLSGDYRLPARDRGFVRMDCRPTQ